MSQHPAPASIVPSPLPPGMQHTGRTAGLRPASPQPVGPPTAAPRTARPTVARYPWYLRFSWLLALGAGILAYVVAFAIMVLTRNPMMVPTVLLVGALAIPLTVLLFAQSSRVGPLVPVPLLLLTAGLGGLFGICAAGFEEAIAGQLLGRASILLVGVIEETAKLVVPLIVLALAHRRTRGGGIVIGIAAGMGFAVLETMGYGFTALLARNGGLGALDATLVLRGILVPAGHVAWTGAVCAALWYLVETPHKARGVLALLTAYVGAIVLHTAWDATVSGAGHLLIGLVSVAALLTLTILAHRGYVRRVPALAPAAA